MACTISGEHLFIYIINTFRERDFKYVHNWVTIRLEISGPDLYLTEQVYQGWRREPD